jgi:hypothetical protein
VVWDTDSVLKHIISNTSTHQFHGYHHRNTNKCTSWTELQPATVSYGIVYVQSRYKSWFRQSDTLIQWQSKCHVRDESPWLKTENVAVCCLVRDKVPSLKTETITVCCLVRDEELISSRTSNKNKFREAQKEAAIRDRQCCLHCMDVCLQRRKNALKNLCQDSWPWGRDFYPRLPDTPQMPRHFAPSRMTTRRSSTLCRVLSTGQAFLTFDFM